VTDHLGDPLPGPTPLEVASGIVMGGDASARLPRLSDALTRPRAAFEAVLLEALQRPPCVISFSGGRDSSAVLATAVSVARREGLPLPVAVTLRYPSLPATEESDWQEKVIRLARATDWEKVELQDTDLLGAAARCQLLRHGLLFPPNGFVLAAIAEHAAGGTLLTGVGGDEVMTASLRWLRANRVLARQVRPVRGDAKRVMIALSPKPLRRIAVRRREPFDPIVPWLRPVPARLVRNQWEREVYSSPVRFDALIEAYYGSRSRGLALQSMDTLAGAAGARALHPFTHPTFLSAMSATYGRVGPGSRAQAMRHIFSDVLPPEVVTRQSKAVFNAAFWGPQAREFVRTWDGRGVDDSIVDTEALIEAWRNDDDYRGYLLLQSVWLARQRDGAP
jgi:Asparagine synthase